MWIGKLGIAKFIKFESRKMDRYNVGEYAIGLTTGYKI